MPDIDVSVTSSDGISTNDHSLQNRVRITFQEASVHIGAWISLVAVADDILDFPWSLPTVFPFLTGRKSCSSSSSQIRGFYFIDDLLRSQFKNGFRQCLIAAYSNIILYLCRLDQTIISQDQPILGFIKRNLFLRSYLSFRDRIFVKEILQYLSFPNRLRKDKRNIFFLNPLVENSPGIEGNDGSSFAKSPAPRESQSDLFRRSILSNRLRELVSHLFASIGMTTRSATNGDHHFILTLL